MSETLSPERPMFCLLMIVRDEAAVITRAFDSVLHMIDSYVICDTGSLDNTMEIIDDYMTEHNIPGHLITKKWVDFGYNKTYLIEQAHTGGLANNAEYLFWLDADEVFLKKDYITNGVADVLAYPTIEDTNLLRSTIKSNPTLDIFYLITHYGGIRYPRWNIVKNNQQYYWKYPAHEQLTPVLPIKSGILNNFVLLARKEGKNSQDPEHNNKYMEWFIDYLKTEPDDDHCNFYLAQSYQDGGRNQEAIDQYIKYVELDANKSYTYIACIRIGRIAIALEEWDTAEKYLLIGVDIIPDRMEAQFYLIYTYNKIKQYEKSMKFISLKNCNITPDLVHLFVEQSIYDWKYAIEASYVAYMAKEYIIAIDICKFLLTYDKCPETIKITPAKTNLAVFEQALANEPTPLISKFPTSVSTRPQTIIIDDFFPDPDAIRKYALEQEFNVTGNYPGKRTKSFANNSYKALFEKILNRTITYWPDSYNGSFQLTTAIHKSWIHRDNTEYSAIIYLTPNAPLSSGTSI